MSDKITPADLRKLPLHFLPVDPEKLRRRLSDTVRRAQPSDDGSPGHEGDLRHILEECGISTREIRAMKPETLVEHLFTVITEDRAAWAEDFGSKATPEKPPRKEKGDSKSVVPYKYKEKYDIRGDGTVGDDISTALRMCMAHGVAGHTGRDALLEVARVNNVDTLAYTKLNTGMLRMNIGNRLRSKHRRGHTLVIGIFKIRVYTKAPKERE